jgi:hypothetical protein
MRRLANLIERSEPEQTPDDDEQGHRPPDEDELRSSVTVQDAKRGYSAWHEGDEIAANDDWDALLKAINAWMKKSNYYPDIYYVNERGNIETVSAETGKFIGTGWV